MYINFTDWASDKKHLYIGRNMSFSITKYGVKKCIMNWVVGVLIHLVNANVMDKYYCKKKNNIFIFSSLFLHLKMIF